MNEQELRYRAASKRERRKASPKALDLERLYQKHYLRGDTILARLSQQRGNLEGLCELDLAIDKSTGITDQNHVGGVDFVKDLALKAGVTSASSVLDLGCGLGGSARCLAFFWGCRVGGVEVSRERCRSARMLSRLVGLDHLVSIRCGDLMTVAVPRKKVDVLWGQGAWTHVSDKGRLVGRWVPCFRSGGRIAFEDVYLKAPLRSRVARRLVAELEDCWKIDLVGIQVWNAILERHSFITVVREDLTHRLLRDCLELLAMAEKGGSSLFAPTERMGLERALKLAEAGALGYFRLVARGAGGSSSNNET